MVRLRLHRSNTKSREHRSGMEHAQRVMLCAWLSDPGFGEAYFGITTAVCMGESIRRKSHWVSLKKLYDESAKKKLRR